MYAFLDKQEETSTPLCKEEKSNPENTLGVDFSFFSSNEAKAVKMGPSQSSEDKEKRRTTRKKKDEDPVVVGSAMVNNEVPMLASTTSYLDTYAESNAMLRGAIAQTDMLSAQVQEDMDSIRASKTMRSKYTYLTNLAGSAASLISTKIQAIREIDGNITQGHNLDLKRAKDLKAGSEADTNDDLKLMQLYDAFVNVPIGTYNPQGPQISMQTLTTAIPNADPNLARVNMVDGGAIDSQYNQYLANLSPASNRARMEGNPNIKTVVKYNPEDGSRWFDVIDITTNQSVPNIERPGDFLLADTTIDVHNQVARNRNIDSTWPLVIMGNKSVTEY